MNFEELNFYWVTRLKAALASRNIDLTELAVTTNKYRRNLSEVFKGKRKCSPYLIWFIAERTKIPLTEIFISLK